MTSYIYTPHWLEPLLGERERKIIRSRDCKPMQCLPECMMKEEERLPPHQQYIVSIDLNEYFVIDSRRKMIIF